MTETQKLKPFTKKDYKRLALGFYFLLSASTISIIPCLIFLSDSTAKLVGIFVCGMFMEGFAGALTVLLVLKKHLNLVA